jgi:hypothetical protein
VVIMALLWVFVGHALVYVVPIGSPTKPPGQFMDRLLAVSA